jgi:hypothetical protein
MRTLNQIIALFLIISFSSCMEDGDKFTGHIIENGTNKPLSDVMVYIYSETTSSVTLADSVLTDANGRWTSIIDGGSLHFIGKVRKQGYFSKLGSVFDGNVWRDQEPYIWADGPMANRDYFIDAMGYLDISIEKDFNLPGEEITAGLPGHGSSVVTSSTYNKLIVTQANRYHKYGYTIDQKHDQRVRDSIFVLPADTTYLKIRF